MNRNEWLKCTLTAVSIVVCFGAAACKRPAAQKQRKSEQALQLTKQLHEINAGVVTGLRSYSRAQKAHPGDVAKLKEAQATLRAQLKGLMDRYRSTKVPFASARDHHQAFGTYLKDYVAFIETILTHDLTSLTIPKMSPQQRREVLQPLLAAKKKWEGSSAILKANQDQFTKKHNLKRETLRP